MSILILWMFLMPLVACAKNENFLTLESWGNGAPELSISAPSGYAIEKHKGPDFDVHYVRSKNANDPSMGIYIGHHPNSFSSQKKGVERKKEGDVILAKNVEWISWEEKEGGDTTYHCETIIKDAFQGMAGSGVAGLMIHVFVKGPDQKQVNLFRTSAKSLRIMRTGGESKNSNRVIFSAEETEKIGHIFGGKAPFWTPTGDQVEELESLLPKYLKSHPPIDDKPVQDFSEYGRQYFGVTEKERKLIYLNAFCNPSKFNHRWEKEIILVKDGGSCYFQVFFDPIRKEFIGLHYNGHA